MNDKRLLRLNLMRARTFALMAINCPTYKVKAYTALREAKLIALAIVMDDTIKELK